LDSLASVLSVTVPIFGLIGLGYVAGLLKLIDLAGSVTLSEYVFAIALPALIFESVAKADFPPVSPWPLWFAYFTGVAIVWAIGMTTARRVFGRGHRESTLHGFTAAQSNTVLVGVPIILKAFGPAAAAPLFLLIAVHLPIMMTTATLMIEGRLDGRLALRQVRPLLRMLLVHPVVMSLAVSVACRRLGWVPTGQAAAFIEGLGATAIPCALVGVGLGMLRFGMRADFVPALFLSTLKLLLHPALVWLLTTIVVPLPPLWAAVATLFAAMPTGINCFVLANRYQAAQATTSSTTVLSSMLAMVTVTLWLLAVGTPQP
jgi:predicted permease